MTCTLVCRDLLVNSGHKPKTRSLLNTEHHCTWVARLLLYFLQTCTYFTNIWHTITQCTEVFCSATAVDYPTYLSAQYAWLVSYTRLLMCESCDCCSLHRMTIGQLPRKNTKGGLSHSHQNRPRIPVIALTIYITVITNKSAFQSKANHPHVCI